MTIARALLKTSQRAVYASDFWGRWARGEVDLNSSSAGVSVSTESALRLSPVWACVRLLSEDVATLPVGVFTRDGDARRPLPRPRWMSRPNEEFTWVEMVQQLMVGPLTVGDGAWAVTRDRFGEPVEIWPLDTSRMEVDRGPDGRLRAHVHGDSGTTSYGWDNLLLLRGFTLPGRVRGLSPIGYAREAIGAGLAAEQYGSRFFGQGAYAGGVIEFPGDATQEQIDVFIDKWRQHHEGLHNAHKPGVLTGGASWRSVSIPPADAQFIETRKFSATEVARFYRVPPHKIGDLERATFSNIEHQAVEYVVDSLRPWLVRLEAALTSLLPPGQFPKWNVEGLLRGDTLARYTAYTQARTAGWLSVNEIRRLEDMNPVANGDSYLQPLNMGPLGVNPLEGDSDA